MWVYLAPFGRVFFSVEYERGVTICDLLRKWFVAYYVSDPSEKSSNFKAIISERWQIPSQMPFAYANRLARGQGWWAQFGHALVRSAVLVALGAWLGLG